MAPLLRPVRFASRSTSLSICVDSRMLNGADFVAMPSIIVRELPCNTFAQLIPVLHYDADFDRIAELTGQRVQWVAPRASVS